MDQEIEKAIEVFLTHPEADQETILAALANCGIAPPEAWRLYQFVPMAFCHVVLRPHGVHFPSDYTSIRYDSEAQQQRPLSGEPLYQAAVGAAERRLVSGWDPRELLPVFGRSAEYAVINDMLHQGSQLRDIRLIEPALFEFEE
jgi:hypothetical protein